LKYIRQDGISPILAVEIRKKTLGDHHLILFGVGI